MMVDPQETFSHMGKWQARILLYGYMWRLFVCRGGRVEMIIIAYHLAISIFIYLIAILLKNV